MQKTDYIKHIMCALSICCTKIRDINLDFFLFKKCVSQATNNKILKLNKMKESNINYIITFFNMLNYILCFMCSLYKAQGCNYMKCIIKYL